MHRKGPSPIITALALLTAPALAFADPGACPVTTPADAPYVDIEQPPFGTDRFLFGDRRLWTWLPNDGRWTQLAFGEKLFWWSEGYDWKAEPVPALTVTARRLDLSIDKVVVRSATHALLERFGPAMLTGVTLPTYGCWQVTGEYRGHALTFVVLVAPDQERAGPESPGRR